MLLSLQHCMTCLFWPGVSCVDLFVMFGMGDNLQQSCIQINFFSALPSCGRVPCTWLHTVHRLLSYLAPPKITVTDKDGWYPWMTLSCWAYVSPWQHGVWGSPRYVWWLSFSALPSCGRVPCTWLHTVHGLPSSLAPPKIIVSRDTFL